MIDIFCGKPGGVSVMVWYSVMKCGSAIMYRPMYICRVHNQIYFTDLQKKYIFLYLVKPNFRWWIGKRETREKSLIAVDNPQLKKYDDICKHVQKSIKHSLCEAKMAQLWTSLWQISWVLFRTTWAAFWPRNKNITDKKYKEQRK